MPTQITLDRCIINNSEISISSSSTSFSNVQKIMSLDINSIAQKRMKIIKDAKAKGISISYKAKTKDTVKDMKKSYKQFYAEYCAQYELLRIKWESKIEKGIFTGCSDDDEINSTYQIRNKIIKMFNRNEVLGRAYKLNSWVNSAEDMLNSNYSLVKITL